MTITRATYLSAMDIISNICAPHHVCDILLKIIYNYLIFMNGTIYYVMYQFAIGFKPLKFVENLMDLLYNDPNNNCCSLKIYVF